MPPPRILILAFLLLPLVLPGHSAAAQEGTESGITVEDLRRAAVRLEAAVPGDAVTAEILGQSRTGNGVVIGEDGLVLTIGYLILEAATVDVVDHSGRRLPAEILAYDFNTGFGLVRALVPLDARPLALGDATGLAVGDRALVLGHDSAGGMAPATVTGRREFAGSWEYLLDAAIYTRPPFPQFGGAGLVDSTGRLVGIGALAVRRAGPDVEDPGAGNVFVPIDLLPPILDNLAAAARGTGARHPWLGMNTVEFGPGLLVQRVAPDGPADRAGIEPGNVVLALEGEPFDGQASFYRRLWSLGGPGLEVELQVLDGRKVRDLRLQAADRYDFLKLDPSL